MLLTHGTHTLHAVAGRTALSELVLRAASHHTWFGSAPGRLACAAPAAWGMRAREQTPGSSLAYYCGLRRYCSNLKKKQPRVVAVKSVEGSELLQNVLQKNKQLLQEKRDGLVRDIRERKDKVKERVEEVIERENVATVPNLLCIGRIVASPYLGYVIVQGDFRLAMGMLIVAGLTDLADGLIARHWPNQASRLGSFLDPMADKVLVGSLVIAMSYIDLLPLWLTAMILFRDVFLIGAGFVIRYISLPQPRTLSRYFDVTHATAQLAPTFISKLNTAVQLVTVAATLGAPIFSYVDHAYLHGLWYLTGFTTVAAAASYLTSKDTYKILRKKS
ncbi:probable cardiolipin synthase (CMP-forming) isoform X2 [Anopheles merus]|uniref:probable cardiolipin synthase (CMP-forming) isoform X2 n=1 Tax=Anopheles merus TaxID=30066 RepID=UPI001BE41EE3|nr:probable cardiolipin synthase (CMP-forming) isoform X2 [Anopheles merus]